jgi:hypothetical protein
VQQINSKPHSRASGSTSKAKPLNTCDSKCLEKLSPKISNFSSDQLSESQISIAAERLEQTPEVWEALRKGH